MSFTILASISGSTVHGTRSTPRATKELADGVNDLVCWVNYSDAKEFDETLYLIELVEHDGTDAVAELYEGNDPELVQAAIRGILEKHALQPKGDAHAGV